MTSWWQRLSTGWRVNVGLYCLATVALVALVAQLAIGDGGRRRVEVASRGGSTTTSSLATTTSNGPTTTLEPATTAPPPASEGATTTRPPGAAPTGPPALVVTPGPPSTVACRNSSDPRCGPFRFDPPPAANQPLNVVVNSEVHGAEVTFHVTVSDPDHAVSNHCSQVDFGDGSAVLSAPCASPSCPPAFGPWDPPAAQTGIATFDYPPHSYASGKSYTARLTFHSDKDTCPLLDPYGSAGTSTQEVTVT